MSGLRLVVDLDLCQGHGVCESEAPAVLRVDRDLAEHKVVVDEAAVTEAHRAQLELAVKYCPTHALRLVED